MSNQIFEIKSRFTGHVIFTLICNSFKMCVEAAVKSGADLSGANLSGANGENKTIKLTPIQILGLRWDIILFDDDMKIGCEYHSIKGWWSYDEDRINKMDNDALDFWKANKTMLQALCEANGR